MHDSMKKYTIEEFIKFRTEWEYLRDHKIDYTIYRNDKIHRRHIMLERADYIANHSLHERWDKLAYALRNELNGILDEVITNKKYVDDKTGRIVYLSEERDMI